MQRILVVKLADLGDVLICEPAIRSLRGAFPAAEIDVLVPPTSVGVVELMDHDTHAITFPKYAFDQVSALADPRKALLAARAAVDLRVRAYEAVVILHHLTTSAGAVKFRALARATGTPLVAGLDNGRGTFLTHRVTDRGFGALHEAEYMLAVAQTAGGIETHPGPRLTLSAAPAPFTLPTRYIALFPATGPYSTARMWPTERFVTLAHTLHESGWPVIVVGSTDATAAAQLIQQSVPDAVDLTAKTTLTELATVIGGAAAVVGGDSFIGHLGAALGRPTVSIFGPSNIHAWKPYGSVVSDDCDAQSVPGIVVRHALPCEPCIYTGYSLGRPAGCPDRTCLNMVSVNDVLNATLRVLEAI